MELGNFRCGSNGYLPVECRDILAKAGKNKKGMFIGSYTISLLVCSVSIGEMDGIKAAFTPASLQIVLNHLEIFLFFPALF